MEAWAPPTQHSAGAAFMPWAPQAIAPSHNTSTVLSYMHASHRNDALVGYFRTPAAPDFTVRVILCQLDCQCTGFLQTELRILAAEWGATGNHPNSLLVPGALQPQYSHPVSPRERTHSSFKHFNELLPVGLYRKHSLSVQPDHPPTSETGTYFQV